MCAINEPNELAKQRRRRKPILAYKVIKKNGKPSIFNASGTRYGPGICKAMGFDPKYLYSHTCRGIHVYRTITGARDWRGMDNTETIVVVSIDPNDMIAAETGGDGQLVASKITITKEAWEKAGLPPRVERRRYI